MNQIKKQRLAIVSKAKSDWTRAKLNPQFLVPERAKIVTAFMGKSAPNWGGLVLSFKEEKVRVVV